MFENKTINKFIKSITLKDKVHKEQAGLDSGSNIALN